MGDSTIRDRLPADGSGKKRMKGHMRHLLAAGAVLGSIFAVAGPAVAGNGMLVGGGYVGGTGDKEVVVLCDDRYTGTAETCAVAHPTTGDSQGVPVNVGGIVGTLRVAVPGGFVEQDVTLHATSYGGFVGGDMGGTTFVDVCMTSKVQKKGGKPSERVRGDNTCARILKQDPSPSEVNKSVQCGAVTWQYDKNGDICSTEAGYATGSFAGLAAENIGFILGIDSADASVPGAITGTVCSGRKVMCNPSPATGVSLEGPTPMAVGNSPAFIFNFAY